MGLQPVIVMAGLPQHRHTGNPALMADLQAGRTAPLGSLAKILSGSRPPQCHLAGSGRLLTLRTALLPIPGSYMPHDGDLQRCRP